MMVAFSAGLVADTQYYFITNILVQNTFIVGIITVFVGALLFLRPKEHLVWSLVMMTMGVDELVLIESIAMSVPLLQISAIGPAAAGLALLTGAIGLRFKPA